MTRAALAALALIGAASCSRAPEMRVAVIDGGTESVAWLEPASVQAQPGDTVVFRNANTGDASPWHAFVPSSDVRPPLFVPAAGGVAPNPAVWGECHGGDARDAVGGCPVATIEGPTSWDGSAYWSTGQILPGEERTVPLNPEIELGTFRFVCVFHPKLVVQIEVVTEPVELEPGEVEVAAAQRSARAPARADVVRAGVLVQEPLAEVLAFLPPTIEVNTGGTVTWRVSGPSPHTVEFGAIESVDLLDTVPPFTVPNASRAGWNGRDEVHSGFMSTDASAPGGSSFSLRFTRPGAYDYVCRFHAAMTGTVRVR